MPSLLGVLLVLGLLTTDQVVNNGGGQALLLDTTGRFLNYQYSERVARHEAGHFLIAYLLGVLPEAYTLSSWDAYQRYKAINVQVCLLPSATIFFMTSCSGQIFVRLFSMFIPPLGLWALVGGA